MKNLKAQFNLAGLLSLIAPMALLVACGTSNASPQAETLRDANAIFVEGNQCAANITEALAESDLGVTTRAEDADSTLKVSVNNDGRNLDELPEFGGIGHKAAYSASLIGAEGIVLFSTTGDEGSISYDEMCEDIGDEIAERMKERRYG